ncbi:MAG: hypothetical protein KJ063_00340 [Anaerolineae bacterium]|nr:hypothetical protein [Anaerolineae bacterium]
MSNDNKEMVQACITTVGFPETLDGVRKMLVKNEYKGKGKTDLDILIEFDSPDKIKWTALRWMTQGDILFFYHTKGAKKRVANLYQQAVDGNTQKNTLAYLLEWTLGLSSKNKTLVHALERTLALTNRYSGTIFACAKISGKTEYSASDHQHFGSKYFAPLEQVHVFAVPLPLDRFSDLVTIGQAVTTPLYSRQLDGIKNMLAQENRLPNFLSKAEFSGLSFLNVTHENWPTISCAPETRFIYEAQIRIYLLDHLLSGIKDKGTPLLEECRCVRNGKQTGSADYFVKLHDVWVPVEAKLNILTERDILDQVAKYINIESFTPTKGKYRGKSFAVHNAAICLVMDQSGVYAVSEGDFVQCRPGMPIWRREQLNHETALEIRDWVKVHFLP